MLKLQTLTRVTQICGLLGLLSGCYNSMYGIPQQEWVRLNEQQKQAVMDDYYAQQRAQYNAVPNYYPAPVYPAQTNIYYTPAPAVVPVPTYVTPRYPNYSEQRRREAEQRASEIRAREEFARRAREESNYRAREEARRHEHPVYQPRTPNYTPPPNTPYVHRHSDDAPRLPHNNTRPTPSPVQNRPDDAARLPTNNAAQTRPIQAQPAHNHSRFCNGDCKHSPR